MKNILRMVLVTLITSIFLVGSSFGGTDELMNLVQNKVFWSTYKWGKLDESELYHSTKWTLTGMGNDGYNHITHHYTTNEMIDFFGSNQPTVIVMNVHSDDNTVISYYIHKQNPENTTINDYDKLVAFCNEIYGDTRVEKEKTRNDNGLIYDITTSAWKLDNTIIKVSFQKNLSQGIDSVGYLMTLAFEKNK